MNTKKVFMEKRRWSRRIRTPLPDDVDKSKVEYGVVAKLPLRDGKKWQPFVNIEKLEVPLKHLETGMSYNVSNVVEFTLKRRASVQPGSSVPPLQEDLPLKKIVRVDKILNFDPRQLVEYRAHFYFVGKASGDSADKTAEAILKKESKKKF